MSHPTTTPFAPVVRCASHIPASQITQRIALIPRTGTSHFTTSHLALYPRPGGYDESDLPDVIILLKVIVSLFYWKKWLVSPLLSTVVTAKCACIRNTNVCFFSMYANTMHADQVGQHFNLRPNFELYKRRQYPRIPTGMRYDIKGRWHQCESFHWFTLSSLYW